MNERVRHQPVMRSETVEALAVIGDGRYLDATAGWGGHAEAIAQRLDDEGHLLALDRDAMAVEAVRRRLAAFGERVQVLRSSYGKMTQQAATLGWQSGSVSGIVMDLGVGSHQLDDAERGFAFSRDGELDMRYHRDRGPTAADLVADLDENELADTLFRYGEERQARRVARAIVRRRAEAPLRRTTDLAEVVSRALGGRRGRRTHPATRTFQALRIRVNGELDELKAALPQAVELLAPGGRLAVLSFHSLEDRVVKNFLREQEDPCTCPPDLGACVCQQKPTLKRMRKRAFKPSAEEVDLNPRARSALLRVAVRTEPARGEVLDRKQ
jgi:16S rRNA (cytosine1402-N4)-methyltransferase